VMLGDVMLQMILYGTVEERRAEGFVHVLLQ
jgi:hypothetical protein